MSEDSKELTIVKPIEITEFNSSYNTVVTFAQKQLKNEVDFGIIPGTKKKTLLKAGAEKLSFLFGLKPKFEVIKEIEDFEKGLFFYKYRCILIHFETGKFAGEAVRSCNSMEKKYAFTTVGEKFATEDQKKRAIEKFQNSNGYWTLKVPKTPYEMADQANTIEAMAQKRALVAATVHATMATEIFDADVDTENETEAPNRKVTKEEDPRRASISAKLFTAAAERGFEPEEIKQIIYKKANVSSLTELSNERLEEVYEKVASTFKVVGKGNKPELVNPPKTAQIQEAEVVVDQPKTVATEAEQASLMAEIYKADIPETTEPKEEAQKQEEEKPAIKMCYNKEAHPDGDVPVFEGENFCSPECKEDWSSRNYSKKSSGKERLDAIVAKKKSKEGTTATA